MYRVFVIETSDLAPRNESGLPNLATCVTADDPEKRFQLLLTGRVGPKPIRGHVVCMRTDLSIAKVYPTLQRAKRAEENLERRLLRLGYIVNRKTPHRRVYVVELDGSHLVNAGKGYLYVGETSETPEVRFHKNLTDASNKDGYSIASRHVTKHRVRLRPDLAPTGFFLSKAESEQAEAD